jgi:hypothetical protein
LGQSNKNNNRTNNNEPLTAPLRYGGERGNINSCAFNKHCAGRQFSASNPPQRKAAKRYRQVYRTATEWDTTTTKQFSTHHNRPHWLTFYNCVDLQTH